MRKRRGGRREGKIVRISAMPDGTCSDSPDRTRLSGCRRCRRCRRRKNAGERKLSVEDDVDVVNVVDVDIGDDVIRHSGNVDMDFGATGSRVDVSFRRVSDRRRRFADAGERRGRRRRRRSLLEMAVNAAVVADAAVVVVADDGAIRRRRGRRRRSGRWGRRQILAGCFSMLMIRGRHGGVCQRGRGRGKARRGRRGRGNGGERIEFRGGRILLLLPRRRPPAGG